MLGTVEVLVVALKSCKDTHTHTHRERERERERERKGGIASNPSWSGKLIMFSLSPTIIAPQ